MEIKYEIEDIDDCVKIYFNELKTYKPLTKKVEHDLLKKYRKNNDLKARNELITHNLKYACRVANGFRGRGICYSDLISEANRGLIESIDKFDISKDVKLISYSVWWMKQKIQIALDKKNKIQTEDIPSDSKRINEEDDENFSLIEEKDSMPFHEDIYDEDYKKKFINEIFKALTSREIDIINMYYGIGHKKNYTLEEIGNKYNLTKVRSRQIIERGLKKIRTEAMFADEKFLK